MKGPEGPMGLTGLPGMQGKVSNSWKVQVTCFNLIVKARRYRNQRRNGVNFQMHFVESKMLMQCI